jgi:NAD(P)-dependent dehydrogenase (short-subunit alcohol dehydrogenase family)
MCVDSRAGSDYALERRTRPDRFEKEAQVEKVALVTGAYRGIGLEVSRQLARLGFNVLLTARDSRKAEAAALELSAGGLNVVPLQLDVTDDGSVEAARARVEERFGGLDVLVNNAAILYDSWQRASSADFDTVRKAFETNTLGAWRVARAFIPMLRAARGGRIVNVSSEAGSLASMNGSTPAYSVSKVALNALTRMLAAELRGSRVLVNAVCPGWVATEMGGPDAPRTPEEGAAGVVWAATLDDDGPTGGFFRDGEPLAW